MSKFLETLNQKFDPDKELDLIIEYLTAMTKVNRFNLIVKMLDNKVKEGKVCLYIIVDVILWYVIVFQMKFIYEMLFKYISFV